MILSLAAPVVHASAPLLAAEEAVLPNGLRIVAHSWPEAPLASVKLLLPLGAAGDPPGRSGLAHLVEHLSYEGSANAPGNTFDTWLGAAGGSSDASTSHDHVVCSVTAPPEALPLALFLESDRLGWLTPTAEALANQQAVVANERAETSLVDQVREALAPLLWPLGHPYARPVIGRPEEVAAVTLADVKDAVARGFRAEGALLVVVGADEAPALVAEARRWFGEVAGRDGAAWLPPTGSDEGRPGTPITATAAAPRTYARWRAEGSGAVRAWARGDVDRVRLRVAWRTVDRDHPDRVALELAGAWLADVLQDDGVEVNAWSGRYGGELTLAANVDAPGPTLRRIEHAVERLAWVGPEDADLARIRAMARAWELRGLQTAEGRAAVLLGCAERVGTPDCLPAEWEARDALDAAAVREAARRWLAPGARVLLAVAPSSRRAPPLPRMTLLAPP